MMHVRRCSVVAGRLVLIVFLLFSTTSCRLLRTFRPESECYKYDKAVFKPCIEERFPVGSSYSDLEDFLLEDGFRSSQNPDDLAENRFYFRWNANNLTNGFTDYAVVVAGNYDEGLKITDIEVN